jgi:hypothetical protein
MNKPEKRKGFFGRLIEKLDKKMEEKAKVKPCCHSKDKGSGKSCCS